MNVQLISYTSEPERVVAMAAKLCYSSSSIDDLLLTMSDEDIATYIHKIKSLGHDSVFEHISFTFGIEGVSRILEQQLTRHRIASYSIQSGRYVNRANPIVNLPEKIKNNPDAYEVFKACVENSNQAYADLIDILKLENMSNGASPTASEKMALEDARYVLANGLETKIVCTMNARSLFNFFEKRCCRRAQKEINELAWQMLSLVVAVAPNVFFGCGPSCIKGLCEEGKLSCRNPYKL